MKKALKNIHTLNDLFICLFVCGQSTSVYSVVYFYWASIMKEELFTLHSDWHLNDSRNLEFMISTPSMTSAKEI